MSALKVAQTERERVSGEGATGKTWARGGGGRGDEGSLRPPSKNGGGCGGGGRGRQRGGKGWQCGRGRREEGGGEVLRRGVWGRTQMTTGRSRARRCSSYARASTAASQ
eukprot:627840-Rhodomonas_salina.1